jgi:uncharacterized protein
MTRYLVVFAKAPVLGQVKTRLGRDIGALAALRFYRRTLAVLLRRVGRDGRWTTVLAVSPDRAAHRGRFWPMRVPRCGQGRGDLGERMARALRAFGKSPVCIVGGDIPDLAAPHLWRAFRALGAADVVFGPAEDGGYWLVGTKPGRVSREMFRNVRWSTGHALADTRATLTARRVALVDELSDVDDGAAYRR